MANRKNLVPQAHKLTVDEQSKGGKKSVKSKKQKKFIKEQLESMLQQNLTDTTLVNNFRKFGFVEEGSFTVQSGIICSLIVQALHRKFKSFSTHTRSNWSKS